MRYFVSGHRDLTRQEFEEHYVPLIQKVIIDDNCAQFIVGDWEGCDLLFIQYMIRHRYINYIHLYYVHSVRLYEYFSPHELYSIIDVPKNTYDECDEAMTRDSDFDIAWIRPGKEDSHTAKNIKRRYVKY